MTPLFAIGSIVQKGKRLNSEISSKGSGSFVAREMIELLYTTYKPSACYVRIEYSLGRMKREGFKSLRRGV